MAFPSPARIGVALTSARTLRPSGTDSTTSSGAYRLAALEQLLDGESAHAHLAAGGCRLGRGLRYIEYPS